MEHDDVRLRRDMPPLSRPSCFSILFGRNYRRQLIRRGQAAFKAASRSPQIVGEMHSQAAINGGIAYSPPICLISVDPPNHRKADTDVRQSGHGPDVDLPDHATSVALIEPHGCLIPCPHVKTQAIIALGCRLLQRSLKERVANPLAALGLFHRQSIKKHAVPILHAIQRANAAALVLCQQDVVVASQKVGGKSVCHSDTPQTELYPPLYSC